MNFNILLFGGGIAYHVTTELLACPENEGNFNQWMKLLLHLAKIFIGYAIAGLAITFARIFGGDWGWLLVVLGIIFGYFWVIHYLLNLHKPIKALLSSPNK